MDSVDQVQFRIKLTTPSRQIFPISLPGSGHRLSPVDTRKNLPQGMQWTVMKAGYRGNPGVGVSSNPRGFKMKGKLGGLAAPGEPSTCRGSQAARERLDR